MPMPAVAAMRDGAVNYLEKPIDLVEMLESIQHSLKLEISKTADDMGIPDLPENGIHYIERDFLFTIVNTVDRNYFREALAEIESRRSQKAH